MRRVTAPGKLVLLGEYAVLEGAPAVVAAIDRGVVCEITPSEAVEIETPGDDRYVRVALREAPPGRYQFRDARPIEGLATKPGFGGSAAATVAACVAAGKPATEAFGVHSKVQGGGSGIDVYASAFGGVRAFSIGASRAPSALLECPPMVAVWSGKSAATGPRIRQFLAWPQRAAFVRASGLLAGAFRREPFGAMREAYARLKEMTKAAAIDYDLPVFAHISALAERYGGAAKPSGAGGGDVAVALLPDPLALGYFVSACRDDGLITIDVNVSPGVVTTRQ